MLVRHIITAVLTVAPVIGVLLWLYTADANREPWRKILKTFFLGAAAAILALIFFLPMLGLTTVAGTPTTFFFLLSFLGAAIPEESAKLLVIRGYCARLPSFDEPMDGLVYGATAALGFALFENIVYVAQGTMFTAIIRGLTAVPGHAILGAMIGYSISSAMFEPESRSRTWKGLVAAILCHGSYNMFLMQASYLGNTSANSILVNLFYALAFAIVIGEIIWFRRTVRRLRSAQLLADAAGRSTEFSSQPSYLERLREQTEADADPE